MVYANDEYNITIKRGSSVRWRVAVSSKASIQLSKMLAKQNLFINKRKPKKADVTKATSKLNDLL